MESLDVVIKPDDSERVNGIEKLNKRYAWSPSGRLY